MSLIVPGSLTETDPVFSAAPASGIAAGDITNWDTAYGWGNHAAAGYLDDYEEGTWTPTYRGSVSDPTVTYSATRSGQYTKIGNMVFCRGDLRTDAFTGGSGAVRIGGLPFTTTNSPSNAGFGFVSVYSGDGASFAGDVPISGQSIYNSTEAVLQYRTSANGSWSELQMADLADGSSKNFIKFVIYYQV